MKLDRLFFFGALGVFFLDQFSKGIVRSRFILGESLSLLPGFALTYVHNPGAAFSMLANAPEHLRRPFFLGVAVVAVAAILWMLHATDARDRITRLALGLVLGGALGNALDRVRFGEVVDFFEVGVRSVYVWPIFNVADSAVCIGVTLLLWRSFKPLPAEAGA